MSFNYVPKVGKVYAVSLPSSGAWTAILTEAQAKAVRGIKIKPRFTIGQRVPQSFDIAFSSSPDIADDVSDGTAFISNAGAGLAETFAPTSGVWARTTRSNVVIEIQTFD